MKKYIKKPYLLEITVLTWTGGKYPEEKIRQFVCQSKKEAKNIIKYKRYTGTLIGYSIDKKKIK